MVEKLSLAPARILGVQGGVLAEGVPADVTVVDPDCKYTWTKEGMLSKGKNSPFIGRELQGRAVLTIVGGRIAYREGL